jgi:hypothetical protein
MLQMRFPRRTMPIINTGHLLFNIFINVFLLKLIILDVHYVPTKV